MEGEKERRAPASASVNLLQCNILDDRQLLAYDAGFLIYSKQLY